MSTGTSNRRVYITVGYADIAFAKEHGHAALTLYHYLSLRMGTHTSAWPSYSAISRDTGMARATIAKNIEILVTAGALTVTRTAGEVNHYTVQDLPEISQPQPATSSEIELVTSSEIEHEETSSPEETSEYSSLTTFVPHSDSGEYQGMAKARDFPEPPRYRQRSDGTFQRERTAAQKPRDDVANLLGSLWGGIPHKGEAGMSLFWSVVSQWIASGFNPGEIEEAHAEYRRQHPTWEYTMTAVVKHARSLLANRNLSPPAKRSNFEMATDRIRREIDRAGLQPVRGSDALSVPPAHAGQPGQLGATPHRYLPSLGPSQGGDGGLS